MSTSHRIITVHPSIITPNYLHIIKGVMKEFRTVKCISIARATTSSDFECFFIYFSYAGENRKFRKLFINTNCCSYTDVNGNTIHSGGLYFNLNVGGNNKEIMDIVKAGIRKHVTFDVDIYESVNDAIDDRFVRVVGE